MKYKGLISIFISFIFLLVIVFTVFSVFTVKEVNVEYEVYASGKIDADIIDEKLSKYNGKNLLFLSIDDIVNEFSDYTYFEVVSAKKDFPNAITVTVKERLEIPESAEIRMLTLNVSFLSTYKSSTPIDNVEFAA